MKIRVLHCIETIASGGVEQTLLTLIRGLGKDRFEHKVICTWHGGSISETFANEGVELIALGAFNYVFDFSKLKKVIQISRDYKPHIIHGGVFEGMTMATFAGLFIRKAVVILEETSDPQNRSKKANFLIRIYSLFIDSFQAISPNVGNYLENVTHIPKSKIKVISNGVEIPKSDKIKNEAINRENLGIEKGCFLVGFVGRLYNDHKRITDLIEALAIIGQKNIKLIIIGEGPDRGLLERKIDLLGINKNVLFTGYQSDPNSYYPLMDVLCVPSSREGFGLVAVEAMFNRLPVVATEVGGLKDVVIHGETGLLVKPFMPNELAESIKILYDFPELRKKFGNSGFLRAKKNYSSEKYCHEVEIFYVNLLVKKGILKISG
jgi:glycosyltransferase involved in cell wall biosynthesis